MKFEEKYSYKKFTFEESLNRLIRMKENLPEKQKKAFLLAIENNYYEYPRKIELEKLAKIMKVSLSTYQERLRKAELMKKILPKEFLN